MKFLENHKLKGAISIFLVIITVTTMLLSAVLIDGSRMSSAKAMTQEAADLAAASALAAYNEKLKDQFGLFAIDDNAKLESIYKESLNATLLAYGMADEEYSDRIWDIMKTTLTGQKSYMGESFLNLYDFSVDECTVEPKFPLIEKEVLKSQMVEYAKFRGLYVMMDRFDILNQLGNVKKQAEEIEESSNVMKDKMQVDEDNAAADEALQALRLKIDDFNKKVDATNKAKDEYITSLKAEMEKIRIDNIDTEEELSENDRKNAQSYGTNRTAFKDAAEATRKAAYDVLQSAKNAKTEVEKAQNNLTAFNERNQGTASTNETVNGMVKDSTDNIQKYKDKYLPGIQKILDDGVLQKLSVYTGIKADLNEKMNKIDDAINDYSEVIDDMREAMANNDDENAEDEEITEYYYYYLNRSGSTEDISAAVHGGNVYCNYEPAVRELIKNFESIKLDKNSVNPEATGATDSQNKVNENIAKDNGGKTGEVDTNQEGEEEKREVEEAVYNARPSNTASDSEKKSASKEYSQSKDLSGSRDILDKGKHNMIQDVGEAMRDDVLCFSYMFGTFKTRLTGVKKFSSEGMSQSDKDSFYMPKWRYAHPNGELDMRFSPKKERSTVLRSEIEYLVYGKRKDAENEAAVYATIFTERLANNMIALYGNEDVNSACHTAAAAIAAACALAGVPIPEPVFFWIFLTAWTTAETILDMNYLISGGYKIPLIKTSSSVLTVLGANESGEGLISNYGETGVFVSYEDYLMILLLLKGDDKRIMRTADLVEMNMKKNDSADFTMKEAYTYLHADSKMSIRYLFGSVQPFQSSYESKGYTGRMKFNNTIYMGY